MAHYDLTLPVAEEAVRRLRVNDTVTLQRTLYGIRDATQIAMFDKGWATRFDLSGHAVIHTAPNVKKVQPSAAHPTGYAPVCIGTTTSMRMERFTDPLLRLGVRIIVGKGGLGAASLASFRELGGVYLAIIGGTALSGGSGTVVGAMLGALVISVIRTGLTFFGVTSNWTGLVTGAVIVGAVAVDVLVRRRRSEASG